MSVHKDAWAVVRRCTDDNHEWIDLDTVSADPEYAQASAWADDEALPDWAKANPVVRLARVSITEIPEIDTP